MKLVIENLAKIESADIDLNGITLIAGANDTGKSTCGKALCTLMSVFSNLSERVKDIRVGRLLGVFNVSTHRHFFLRGDDTIAKYLKGEMPVEKFCKRILSDFPSISRERPNVESLCRAAEEVRMLSEVEIQQEAILRAFSVVFNDQYRPLTRIPSGRIKHGATLVELKDGESLTSVTLSEKTCEFKRVTNEEPHAWYLSNPKIVDSLSVRYWGARDWFEGKLISSIQDALDFTIADPVRGAFDAAMMKKKLAVVEKCFAKVNDDKLTYDKDKGVLIRRKSFVTPLKLANASMGLKGIALIRIMLENAVLRPGDFLVLDEPEIHLHPEWQLCYAELVVLLRKEFGITILLTTHSPDFIQAIRVFAKKYDIMGDVSAYLTIGNERTRLKQVKNGDWDELFNRFMPTVNTLEKLTTEVGG